MEEVALTDLHPHPDNPRHHSAAQLKKIARSIERYGFTNPILISDDNRVIAGHGRLEAARLSKFSRVPAIRLAGLSPDEQRALMLADNQLALESEWDPARLAKVLSDLIDVEFDMEDTGFDTGAIDLLVDHDTGSPLDEADLVQPLDRNRAAVSRSGDLFLLGPHRLLCGDALDAASYQDVLGDALAGMVFTDPPYNVPIAGHVSGRQARHGEFLQASGEMSESEYQSFLENAADLLSRFTRDGAIVEICIDWRHVGPLLSATQTTFALKNICVWVKDSGGQGSLYRSQHELVLVLRNGTAAHVNNVALGRHGRNRTNVWRYPGANSFHPDRRGDLAIHPTVKPVAMVADAILDCSRIGDVILDPFAGSGTILLACERTSRRAAAIEFDPQYVDAAVRRFQERTGIEAIHAESGLTLTGLAAARATLAEAS